MKIYAIRTRVPYGEYVEVVCAKDKREAQKICEKFDSATMTEVKLIKPTKNSGRLFFGGMQE